MFKKQRAPFNHRVRVERKPVITTSEPYPLLEEGQYLAECTEADYDWSHRWRQNKARLVLSPQDYTGKPYTGRLCRFFNLGQDRNKPHAGSGSDFRALWVEVNRGQPVGSLDMDIFLKHIYRITVVTVKENRNGPMDPVNWYSIVREIHLAKTFELMTLGSNSDHSKSTLPEGEGRRDNGSPCQPSIGETRP